MSNKKKVFIKTYGCQMNEYDSEKLVLDLEKNHYEQTSEIQEADMVVLNTCNICLLYTSPSPRDLSTSRMPSSA